MARVETIVAGGGVAATAPFTVRQIPMVSSSDPPAISNSILRQTAAGAIIVGATDPQPAATETFRTTGGLISEEPTFADTVRIGRLAEAKGGGNTVSIGKSAGAGALFPQAGTSIGPNAVAGGSGIAIGLNAFAGAGSGSTAHVCIAGRLTATAAGSDGVTILSNLGACTGAVGIRSGIVASGQGGVFISGGTAGGAGIVNPIAIGGDLTAAVQGNNGIAMGASAFVQAGHHSSMCFGAGSKTTQVGQVVFGTDSGTVQAVTDMVLGGDSAAAPLTRTYRVPDGFGANIVGSDHVVMAGRSTGNATNASVLIQSSPVGGAGSVINAARTGLSVRASAVAGDTDILVFDVTAALLVRVTRGAADSGGVGFRLLRIPN
jgi:hypothetical protein